jgi:ATP-dependent 26S proteasome regulatory subunit
VAHDKRFGALGLGDLVGPRGGTLMAVDRDQAQALLADLRRTMRVRSVYRGRVDLAVEVPLPDAACRRRLLELYGRGLTLRVSAMDNLIERTEGVSPAFIRELLRKAALLAVGPGDEIVVEDGHLTQAIRELVADDGGVTRRLLGWSGS